MKKESHPYLNSGPQCEESVAGIAHLEYTAKPILGEVPDLEDLQVRRDGAEIELGDEDVIDDNRRLRVLVQGVGQELLSALIELGVRREWRPVEVKGHGGSELAFDDF